MTLLLIILVIGIIGAFMSGLVGIGGSIIIYPLLLFIPRIFGYELSPHEVAGLTASQVFFSTLSGSISQRNNENLSYPLIISMGIGILIGSLAGAYSATLFDESIINLVYTILAIVAVILMFIKVTPQPEKQNHHYILLTLTALVIGYVSGIVGAGGAFIIVPVLLAIFKVPFRTVVANSIVIAFISSIGTFALKAFAGEVSFQLMIPLVISSLIFAPLGVRVSHKTDQRILKWILSLMILAAAVKMVFEIIN
ncbi:sulfite exporter TauE/SafE family protein [Macrococcus hajekii]|uniref:Probable membrane transporter protein n=1 Tax=Macrococcus hajekii TaxID=198482 RepID=A0A4R6BJV8_9STAP|nr:sulfite exporter TauE/SafE family protein [Macrococcus hajekii]TDM01999.1 sulfite exporter TauE/SafE family protein [Macrococcus hajekii]GGB09183.1 UPF0721 transmembrane protein [Macrococcus hajekii]